jgi:hypothetical protein
MPQGRVFIEGPVLDYSGNRRSAVALRRVVLAPARRRLQAHPDRALDVRSCKKLSYQSGSRNPRPPDRLAFCRRYSA